MKRTLVSALLVATAITLQASDHIDLGFGNLYQANGTTLAPTGSLIQFIVSSTDNVFTAPTATSFTGGSADDVILKSIPVNQGPGAFLDTVIFNLSGNINAGDQLLIRWYPTLTLASAAPGAGTPYGEFRTDALEAANGSTIAWFVPADGANDSLNFLTTLQGGTHSESEGRASLTVAAVPEPSTYLSALLGLAGIGATMLRRRLKK